MCEKSSSALSRVNQFFFDVVMEMLKEELVNARERYPSPDGLTAALAEHSGKVAQAMLDAPWYQVQTEALELIVIAIRIIQEGDPTLDDLRLFRGLDETGNGGLVSK